LQLPPLFLLFVDLGSALEIAAEQEKMLKVESPILHLGFLDNLSILNTMF